MKAIIAEDIACVFAGCYSAGMFQTFIQHTASWLYPMDCAICQKPLSAAENDGVCSSCFGGIRLISGPHCIACGRHVAAENSRCLTCCNENFHFDRAYACVAYEGQIRELLHSYKFEQIKILGNFISKIFIAFFNQYLKASDFDAVIAIALDAQTYAKRGYNQTLVPATKLAKALQLKNLSGCLIKIPSATPQSSLDKTARKKNISGHFQIRHTIDIRDKRILLVDDIITTGQTASECAKTLKDGGAKSVTVLAFARGI